LKNSNLKKIFLNFIIKKKFTNFYLKNEKENYSKLNFKKNFNLVKTIIFHITKKMNLFKEDVSNINYDIVCNLYFISFFKNFLFYRNFSKLFFLNNLFFSNFYKNNVSLYDKYVLSFITKLSFFKPKRFRRFDKIRKKFVHMHFVNLRKLFKKTKKTNKFYRFRNFTFLTRFLRRRRIYFFNFKKRRFNR
jgi:hypothetical protein